MNFHIMTLFPAMVEAVCSESIIGRAREAGIISVREYDIRDHANNKHNKVDDTPYGGGMGMLMSAVPIYNCFTSITAPEVNGCARRRVVYMSPQGHILDQKTAKRLADDFDNIVILCGHYEGVDQRIIDEIVDEEISIGDYVLTGGEIPACILCDAVGRLCPGVLSDSECFQKESFSDGMLEYPQYTRPYDFRGRLVPDVLISGHHENIEKWREEQAKLKTERVRPDLIDKGPAGDK